MAGGEPSYPTTRTVTGGSAVLMEHKVNRVPCAGEAAHLGGEASRPWRRRREHRDQVLLVVTMRGRDLLLYMLKVHRCYWHAALSGHWLGAR